MSASDFDPGPRSNRRWRTLGVIAAAVAALFVLLFVFRAPLATLVLRHYLAGQGMRSHIVVDSLGFGGVTAHGSLDGPNGLHVSVTRLVVTFRDWQLAAIDVERPVLRLDLRAPSTARSQSNLLSDSVAVTVKNAKLSLATAAGTLRIDGDARLNGIKPQAIDAVLRPARLHFGTASLRLDGGTIQGVMTPSGARLRLTASGAATIDGMLRRLRADLTVPALRWSGTTATVPAASLSLTASGDDHPVSLQAHFADTRFATSGGQLRASGTAALTAQSMLPPSLLPSLLAQNQAWRSAWRDVHLDAHFTWTLSPHGINLALLQPAALRGGDSVRLQLSNAELSTEGPTLNGRATADLDAPGITLSPASITWQQSGGVLDAAMAVKGRVDLAGLRNLAVDAQADARMKDGTLSVALQRCADLRLAAYGKQRSPLITNLAGTLCAAPDAPLLTVSQAGWSLHGRAKDVRATAAGLKLTNGAADFSLAGAGSTPQSGTVQLSAVVPRTKAIGTERISGRIVLADAVARGQLQLAAGSRPSPIGTVALRYAVASGAGHAQLSFPDIVFAPDALQPADLSSLLSPLAKTSGHVRFNGHVDWTARGIAKSGGRLEIDDLRFSSPLGTAQRLSTSMVFTSLVPPKTAPDQRIALQRVDWVLPLTQSMALVSFDGSKLSLRHTKTDVAGGEISLTPLSILFKPGSVTRGSIKLDHVALGELIAASNLGDKLALQGSVSGELPFTFGPDGLRFQNGSIAADGPGRLSISRKLWGSGEISSVQKAAYQALENLAFQSLSATVESIPGGRLRTVFRVVGYDDSTGPRQDHFDLMDLLNGKAFQKNLPVPRGTPVNLTLDTTLNFDELLRGYESAWSQLTAQAGASP